MGNTPVAARAMVPIAMPRASDASSVRKGNGVIQQQQIGRLFDCLQGLVVPLDQQYITGQQSQVLQFFAGPSQVLTSAV